MNDLIYGIVGFVAGAGIAGFAVYQKLTQKGEVKLANAGRASQEAIDKLKEEWVQEKGELKKQHNRAFDSVNSDLAFRESEFETLVRAEKEFNQAETKSQVCAALEKVIAASFAADVAHFVVWSVEENNTLSTSKSAEEDPRLVDVARNNFHASDIFERSAPVVLPAENLDLPDGLQLSELNLGYLPVLAHKRRMGIACVFFKGTSHQTKLRQVRQVMDKFSDILYRVMRVDEEYRASRIDPLTGLPNSRAVYDLLPELVKKAHADRPLSAIIIECDNLEEIKEHYGHSVGDQMVQEAIKLIQSSARVEELNSARPPDQYVRYGDLQFLMFSEEADANQSLVVAERIREAFDKKNDWPLGVPKWSVSVGCAVYPIDADDSNDLVTKAEVALMYVKEHDRKNSVARFDQVPRHFRLAKLSGGVSGSLEVFDSATTLQSVARAQGTGILTVTNAADRKFWAFYDSGKPKKAYLDQYKGNTSVVEFLATFEDGRFDFREYNLLDGDALEEIHALDDNYDVKKSLDRLLMDGALAQDQLAEARRLLPNTRLFAKPSKQFKEIIAGLPHLKDPPSREELEAMEALCRHVNGRTMLNAILDRMQGYPTHMRWHAAALLVRNEALELTKLAVSFHL